MPVDMGGSHFRERGVHEKGGSQGGSQKVGFTRGFTKRGVHRAREPPPLATACKHLVKTGYT